MSIKIVGVGFVLPDDVFKKIKECDAQIAAHDCEINSRKDQIRNITTQKIKIEAIRKSYAEPFVAWVKGEQDPAPVADGSQYGEEL